MEQQHFAVSAPLHAVVKVLNARVEVTRSTAGTATCAVQPLDPASAPSVRLAATTRVHLRGDRLEVVLRDAGPAVREGELLVQLGLPEGSQLAVSAGKASIHVRGGLRVLDAKIGAGDVDADSVERALTVKAGQVSLLAGQAGALTVTAGHASLSAQQVTDADIKAGSGEVELGRTDGRVVAKGASLELAVRAARRGDIDFQSVAGSATVAVVAGTAVQLDLISGTGVVRCDLPPESDLHRSDVGLRLRLRSATGDLLVTTATVAASPDAG